ncbi:MAG: helix-turn-helix transcriptional regulator [Candidatus Paceibacterota bacterium]
MNKPTKKNLLNKLLDSITPEEQEKTDKKMILAAKIANAIKAKGLKKYEFAEVLNKQPSEISKWLSGTHNFTIDTLMDIERVLSIKLLDTENWNYLNKYEKIKINPQTGSATIYRIAS